MEYNRNKAVSYAKEWAHGRNPRYYNFDSIGGDCTNFVSQCLYAGSNVMNYTKDIGWYYISARERSAAWSGVEYLRNFLVSNRGPGPCAEVIPVDNAQPGDIIQLSFDGSSFTHSLFVCHVDSFSGGIYIATHTMDSYDRPLNTYQYALCRLLHITEVREKNTHRV